MPVLELIVEARRGEAGANRFTRAVKRSGRAAVETGRQTDVLGRKMTKLGSTSKRVGGLLLGAFAIGGLASSIRGTINVIADFEEAIALTGAVAGVDQTSEAFARLSATAREMGATTRFSATEVAEGLLFLARAGFSAEDAIGTLPATLNLAAAGAIELGRAADIASNIGSVFQEQFGSAVRAAAVSVDVLVVAANSANTDVLQMAEAMKFAGPTAAAFGLTLEDTAASLGQLGNFGIQASLAGTGLRGVLAKLSSPTADLTKRLDKMGIKFSEINPETHDLVQIMRRLKDAGLGAEDAFAIFGNRGAATALILSRMADSTEELREKLKNAEGEAQKIADIMNDTLKGAFLSLKSAIQEAVLQIGDAGFGGALRAVVEVTTRAIRIFIGMGEAVKTTAELFDEFGRSGVKRASEINEFNRKAQILAETLRVLGGVVGTLIGLNLARWFLSALNALRLFTIAAASNPFGLLAIALSVLVGLLIKFRNTEITVFGKSFTLIDVLVASWEHFKDKFAFIMKATTELAAFAWSKIKEFGKISVNAMIDSVNTFLPGIGNILPQVFTAVKTTVENIVRFVRAAIVGLINSLSSMIQSFASSFSAVSSNILTILDPSTSFAVKTGAAGGIAGGFASIGANSADAFTSEFTKALAQDTGIFDAFQAQTAANLDELQKFFDANDINLSASDFEKFLTPWGQFEDISRRVNELAEKRRALLHDETDLGGERVNQVNEELAAELEKLSKLQDAQEGVNKTANDASLKGQGLSRVFGSAFRDLAFGAGKATDAIRNLGKGIADLLFQKLVLDQLSQAFDNLFSSGGGNGGLITDLLGSLFGSANGNAFTGGGGVAAFASGGVPDFVGGSAGAAVFPMRGGGIGIAGEAGPEARVPIKRLSDGTLGVGSTGGGNTTINITVRANNPAEFKKATRQIANDARRALGGGAR